MKQLIRKASKGQKSVPTLASMLMLITLLASLICVGYPSGQVCASDFTGAPEFKLTASDGAANDYFGHSVAMSGDTVVVGAHCDDVGGYADPGSAYIFNRSGTNWTEQAKLTASDGTAGDYFGISVAISGDTVVVGAYGDDVGSNGDQGSAHVFVRRGSDWTQQAQLIASDGAASDYFGGSVAISGDTVVVGAYGDDGGDAGQGSAYVFARSGTTWTEQAKLTASDGAANDYFGRSVAMSGDTAVVGATYDEVGANADQGSAYVYVGREDTAHVSATVTMEEISISVAIPEGYPMAVDYGEMTLSAEAVPTAYAPDTYSYLRVENNGNVAEDLLIKGANATCGVGTWILSETPGADQYCHLYGLGQTPGSYSPLSASASTLGTNVTVGGIVDFNVKIQTPTSSTVSGQYSTTVTVLAVAAS